MNPTRSSVDALLEWFFAVALLGCALFALIYAAKIAHMRMQFDYEEGNILNAGLRITEGQTPYPAPDGWPVIINPYGPIPYLVTAALVKWFGIGFFAPRMVSLLCGALIVFLIGLLIRHFGGALAISVVFACTFLSLDSIRNWLLTSRVDWLALALSFAGLAVFARREKRWYVAALLFSAALFVKYTLLAAPLACGLYLILRRDWKLLWRLVVTSAALCFFGFLLTQRWSGGHFAFYQFSTHPDLFSWSQCWQLMTRRLKDIPFVFAIAAILVASELWRRELTLPVLYFLTATVGALTVGKLGSSTNHLMEWSAAGCLCAGCGWRLVAVWLAGKRLVIASRAVLAGVFATAVIPVVLYRPPFAERISCEPAYAYLQDHGDHVLTDSIGALLLTGKPVLVSNPFVYSQMVIHAGWPDTVLQRVREKEFDVILLREQLGVYHRDDRFTAETLRAIRMNYHEGAAFECYDSGFAYLPNP